MARSSFCMTKRRRVSAACTRRSSRPFSNSFPSNITNASPAFTAPLRRTMSFTVMGPVNASNSKRTSSLRDDSTRPGRSMTNSSAPRSTVAVLGAGAEAGAVAAGAAAAPAAAGVVAAGAAAAGTVAAAGAGGSIIAAAASVQVPERPTTMTARKVKGMFIAAPYRNRHWKFHEQDALKRP